MMMASSLVGFIVLISIVATILTYELWVSVRDDLLELCYSGLAVIARSGVLGTDRSRGLLILALGGLVKVRERQAIRAMLD